MSPFFSAAASGNAWYVYGLLAAARWRSGCGRRVRAGRCFPPRVELLIEADGPLEEPVDLLAPGDLLEAIEQLCGHRALRELHVQDRQLRALDAAEELLVARRRLLRAGEDVGRLREKILREERDRPSGSGSRPAGLRELACVLLPRRGEQRLVLHEHRRGRAVVAGDEVIDQRVHVERRVPHQLRDDPRVQLVALGWRSGSRPAS